MAGWDISYAKVDLVASLERQPYRVGRERVVADATDASAESQVGPCGIGTNICAAVHLQLKVRDGIKVEVAGEQFLGDGIDGTFWQTDAQTASVGTCS